MFVRHALWRLLPLLAVLGLALAPAAVPAAMAQTHASGASQAHAMPMAGMAMDGMSDMAMDAVPCCPDAPGAPSDCAKTCATKTCPMMALCVAKLAAETPAAIGLPIRVAVAQATSWVGDASFASLAQAPPSEPPRS